MTDGRTEVQTPFDGKDRAAQGVARVKTNAYIVKSFPPLEGHDTSFFSATAVTKFQGQIARRWR